MNDEQKVKAIPSFVRRQGRITSRQKQALEKLWPIYGLNLENGPLKFKEIFGRESQVFLEIGFGMGTSLLAMAKENPEHDFIGIEVHRPGVGSLLASLEEENVKNIRVFSEDAREVFAKMIPENSLSKILILFPDPWPKKRHHKRRLINAEFLEEIIKKLSIGGVLHLATDWEEYAQEMMSAVSSLKNLKNTAGEGAYFEGEKPRPPTKFEQRGKNLGHEIWDIMAQKNF